MPSATTKQVKKTSATTKPARPARAVTKAPAKATTAKRAKAASKPVSTKVTASSSTASTTSKKDQPSYFRVGKKLFYLREEAKDSFEKGTPFGCVAYNITQDGRYYHVTFGMSLLNSAHDRWDRELGRKIAEQRLESHPTFSLKVDLNKFIKSFKEKYSDEAFDVLSNTKADLTQALILRFMIEAANAHKTKFVLPRRVLRNITKMYEKRIQSVK